MLAASEVADRSWQATLLVNFFEALCTSPDLYKCAKDPDKLYAQQNIKQISVTASATGINYAYVLPYIRVGIHVTRSKKDGRSNNIRKSVPSHNFSPA